MALKTIIEQMGGLRSSGPRHSEPDAMDVTLKALSNQRRRHTIRYLQAEGDEARVRDIAQAVAAWENGVDPEVVTYDQRKRVYTALYQSHLPKLATNGFIDYDRNRGTVSLTPKAANLNFYLEVVEPNGLLWGEYYLGLSVVFLLLLVAASIGTVPFALVPSVLYAMAFGVIVGVSAIVHVISTRRNALTA